MDFTEFADLMTKTIQEDGLPPVTMEELREDYETFCIEEDHRTWGIEEVIESLR